MRAARFKNRVIEHDPADARHAAHFQHLGPRAQHVALAPQLFGQPVIAEARITRADHEQLIILEIHARFVPKRRSEALQRRRGREQLHHAGRGERRVSRTRVKRGSVRRVERDQRDFRRLRLFRDERVQPRGEIRRLSGGGPLLRGRAALAAIFRRCARMRDAHERDTD